MKFSQTRVVHVASMVRDYTQTKPRQLAGTSTHVEDCVMDSKGSSGHVRILPCEIRMSFDQFFGCVIYDRNKCASMRPTLLRRDWQKESQKLSKRTSSQGMANSPSCLAICWYSKWLLMAMNDEKHYFSHQLKFNSKYSVRFSAVNEDIVMSWHAYSSVLQHHHWLWQRISEDRSWNESSWRYT